MKIKTAGIIGLGRIGTALAVSLERRGLEVLIVRRNMEPSWQNPLTKKVYPVSTLAEAAGKADVLFITTPDDVIPEVVRRLSALEIKAQAALHMSGSLSSEALRPLKQQGLAIGSLHPLQSFPSIEQAIKNLPGSFFTYEGDVTLIPWLADLVEGLAGIFKVLPSARAKVLYHAGAVFVSNYMVGLAQAGIDCLNKAGFTAAEAREALLPLMQGTMSNLAALPPEGALTGPVARGDAGVVASHLQSIMRDLPELLSPYCAMAGVLARIAAESGKISKEKQNELLKILLGGVYHDESHSQHAEGEESRWQEDFYDYRL